MAKRDRNGEVAELYDYLDRAGSARKNKRILEDLNWQEGRLTEAKKILLRQREVYVTQDGIILQRYASSEQQVWHLGWCLGLFETAGIHLTMDRELLLEAPRAMKQLIADGKFGSAKKLVEFRERVLQTMELPKQLLGVYNEVLTIVDSEKKLLESKEALRKKFEK